MTFSSAAGQAHTFLRQVSRSSGLAMVVMLMVAMAVMILPLPTTLIDALIAWNIGASVLILIVAVYLPHPLAFSTLPAVILTATLFRLATEVAVTRLILVQLDAGEIVRAFGDFVVSGNVIVGLVTFLIIMVVQFVVITKGSERVAEVAARFTLDAMPGKQMSIDSDVRSGDIDQREARRRRQLLEQESQLYGAMDGAMKFVKGDAIAGLVIVLVNLLGGIAIGCLQRGMSWGEATHTYSLLTIGDGLVSQIPALIISFSAGTVVTRVTDETDRRNLGAQITREVAGDPRSLMIAAGALALLSLVPGFPTLVFLALAVAAAGRAAWLWRSSRKSGVASEAARGSEAARAATPDAEEDIPDDAMIVLHLSPSLKDAVGNRISDQLRTACHELGRALGLELPQAFTHFDPSLPTDSFRLDIEDVPASAGRVRPQALLLRDDPRRLADLNIAAEPGEKLPGQRDTHWVAREHVSALDAAGIAYANCPDALALAAAATLQRLAAHFMGVQEARLFLARAEPQYKDLVQETQRTLSLQVLAEVCRALLEESVALRPQRLILGALVEAAPKEQHPALLADFVRVALKRQICHRHADQSGRLSVIIVEHDAEDAIRTAAQQNPGGAPLIAPDGPLNILLDAIRHLLSERAEDAPPVVVLTAYEIRRFLRALLVRSDIDVPVMAYQELAAEIAVLTVGSVNSSGRSEGQPSLHLVPGIGGAPAH